MATIRTAGSDPAERQREIERDGLTPPRWPDPKGETDLSAFLARLARLVAREQAAGSGPGRRGPMPGHLLPLLSLDPALLALDAAREAIGVLDLPAHEPSFNRIAGRIGAAACRRRRQLEGTADKGGTSPGLSDLEAILPRRRGKRRRKDLAEDRRRIGDFRDLTSS